MKTYIVLLRGINVGGNNILPMKELTHLLESHHYRDVNTYIQSGNVVLKAKKKPGADIGAMIQAEFGFEPDVLVLSEAEFNTAINNNPYPLAEGKTVHFSFCKIKPKPDIKQLEKLKAKTEAYHIAGKVFYLHAPDGIGRSKLTAKIEKCLGVCATGRNLNTVKKLEKLLQGG